ncbi:unnamed protein product [Peniophora sp. CBMAI 1063]|nr:unnamed protein product [Peniophora sp. CBMAI 1063]
MCTSLELDESHSQWIVFTQLNESGRFDLDAWNGYRADRARVLDHLQQNNITDKVILAGDSHANCVFDLARTPLSSPPSTRNRCLPPPDPNETASYDPATGDGALGVEFAGTAVTSTSAFGPGIALAAADQIITALVAAPGNEQPWQWSEESYRGFFTLTINPGTMMATYYAMENVSNANTNSFAGAQFVVNAGENKSQWPVAGRSVQAGVLESSVVNVW